MKAVQIFLFAFLLLVQLKVQAQFSWVQVGVDGLTCSACSRSVEMSIRKLSFVDSVSMNLENTLGKVTFKKGAKVEIEKLAKAVIDAGFSLRSLYAAINVNQLKVNNDFCWIYENDTYHFIKVPGNVDLNGVVTLRFIGEKYMPKKEFKTWKIYCINNCSPSIQIMPSSKNYHVSLL